MFREQTPRSGRRSLSIAAPPIPTKRSVPAARADRTRPSAGPAAVAPGPGRDALRGTRARSFRSLRRPPAARDEVALPRAERRFGRLELLRKLGLARLRRVERVALRARHRAALLHRPPPTLPPAAAAAAEPVVDASTQKSRRAEQMRERWVNIRRQQVQVSGNIDERRAIKRVSEFLGDDDKPRDV